MGESAKAEISVCSPELESFSVETPGGRIHIRWGNQASVTPNAQQTTLYLRTMRAARTALMLFIANIRAALSHVRKVAEQSPATDRWKTLQTTSWPESFRIGPENSSKHVHFWLATAVFRLIPKIRPSLI